MSKSLVLRVCGANGESHGAFRWPLEVGAVVKAPDWNKRQECGNGLHGWLYGQGDHSVAGDRCVTPGAQWLVLEVDSASIVELGGKVKFPECIVRFVGDVKSATDYLLEHEPRSRSCAVIGACRAEKQDGAMVQVGAFGTATAGDSGTATAGDRGTATAGEFGTATAGDRGTATAGYRGTATAGEFGVIAIEYYDAKAEVYRKRIGAIGEDGLEPNVAYKLDANNKFVRA